MNYRAVIGRCNIRCVGDGRKCRKNVCQAIVLVACHTMFRRRFLTPAPDYRVFILRRAKRSLK
jgi:hypothetical protein